MEERFVEKLQGHYLISCTLISSCSDSSACWVEVCRDISERKDMEKRLQEAANADVLTCTGKRKNAPFKSLAITDNCRFMCILLYNIHIMEVMNYADRSKS